MDTIHLKHRECQQQKSMVQCRQVHVAYLSESDQMTRLPLLRQSRGWIPQLVAVACVLAIAVTAVLAWRHMGARMKQQNHRKAVELTDKKQNISSGTAGADVQLCSLELAMPLDLQKFSRKDNGFSFILKTLNSHPNNDLEEENIRNLWSDMSWTTTSSDGWSESNKSNNQVV